VSRDVYYRSGSCLRTSFIPIVGPAASLPKSRDARSPRSPLVSSTLARQAPCRRTYCERNNADGSRALVPIQFCFRTRKYSRVLRASACARLVSSARSASSVDVISCMASNTAVVTFVEGFAAGRPSCDGPPISTTVAIEGEQCTLSLWGRSSSSVAHVQCAHPMLVLLREGLDSLSVALPRQLGSNPCEPRDAATVRVLIAFT
jgi:hypothetical protein